MTDRELMQQALDALEGAIDAHQNEINDHITKYGEWYRPQRLEFMKKELANTEQTIEALRARLAQPEPKTCWCETCRPITIGDMRMILCPTCGNKRCPRATNHMNECTGSNEPGQKGSSYGGLAQPEPEQTRSEKMRDAGITRRPKGWGKDDEPEPVAYLCENAVGHKYFRWKKPTSEYKPIALYTASPQRNEPEPLDEKELARRTMALLPEVAVKASEQPTRMMAMPELMEKAGWVRKKEWVWLTDEEIKKFWSQALADTEGETYLPLTEFARAIEAKLREKNNE